MQRTPREREQRTLSAHLECRDTFVAVRSQHKSLRETNGKPFCETSGLHARTHTHKENVSCQDLI